MNSSFKLLVILSLVVFVSETVSAQSRDGLTRAQLSLADAYRDYWFLVLVSTSGKLRPTKMVLTSMM